MRPFGRLRLRAGALGRVFWRRAAQHPADVPEMLNVTAVAERCGVSRETVYRWVREGHLRPAARYRAAGGYALLFRASDVAMMRDRRRR